ncbi:unnamed protein product [marine sediment metagenome]|uniref:Glycosyltransferase 2-like domain-containing protein n=1 Tax=marine sediment metagenome TaxID=412755 RepID=X1L1V1_9ZZZZ
MKLMNNQNQKIHLSVIIPAYNEEKRLPKTLREINDYLKKQSYLSEIIVVNDGSTDRTSEVVKELQKIIPNLKLINIENSGKGYAVKKGILEAKGGKHYIIIYLLGVLVYSVLVSGRFILFLL